MSSKNQIRALWVALVVVFGVAVVGWFKPGAEQPKEPFLKTGSLVADENYIPPSIYRVTSTYVEKPGRWDKIVLERYDAEKGVFGELEVYTWGDIDEIKVIYRAK